MLHVTKSEMEILSTLWKAGMPLSRGDILEMSTDKTWKDNSVHILLNSMLKKGVIREDGFIRCGRVWGRLYAPVFTVEEYYAEQFRKLAKPSLVNLMTILVDREIVSPAEIERLQAGLRLLQEQTK